MNLDLRSIVLFLDLQGKSKKAIEIEINNTLQKKKKEIAYSTATKYLRENFFLQTIRTMKIQTKILSICSFSK